MAQLSLSGSERAGSVHRKLSGEEEPAKAVLQQLAGEADAQAAAACPPAKHSVRLRPMLSDFV